ncbi:hypothetical protein PENSPDRAFT_577733 [Peniophora sp. CONT]|nr:hypothetical protein PENSPDRAFT_577733 [Peniophora sp. CONT]
MQHADGPAVDSRLEDVVKAALNTYRSLAFTLQPGKFTILASFVVHHRNRDVLKVISLGTGSKCLPTERLPACGDALHDSHAEVIARRGFIRWLLEEIRRDQQSIPSEWLSGSGESGYALRDDVHVYLYVSTVPCGDASTRMLAAQQDPTTAVLKDSSAWPDLAAGSASRGRDNYARLGVLRTKPGRADAPSVLSMSCSDKIARWNVLGIQGALVSGLATTPISIEAVIIGEVEHALQGVVKADCERAFHERLGSIAGLPEGYRVSRPSVYFTNTQFVHSRSTLSGTRISSNDSICWVADSTTGPEVLINGIRRGISPKHRASGRFKPILSKASLFSLYSDILSLMGHASTPAPTYFEEKQKRERYNAAKAALLGPRGPFSGWLGSDDVRREMFNTEGVVVNEP